MARSNHGIDLDSKDAMQEKLAAVMVDAVEHDDSLLPSLGQDGRYHDPPIVCSLLLGRSPCSGGILVVCSGQKTNLKQ